MAKGHKLSIAMAMNKAKPEAGQEGSDMVSAIMAKRKGMYDGGEVESLDQPEEDSDLPDFGDEQEIFPAETDSDDLDPMKSRILSIFGKLLR